MNSEIESLLREAIDLNRRGLLAQATKKYEQVLRDNPGNIDALYSLARIACQEGRFADGIELVDSLLSIDRGHARSHLLRGMVFKRLGNLDEALASFDRAIAHGPDLAEAHGSRADTLVELGRRREALESYDLAIDLKPDSVENWCNRGAASLELRLYEEAIACFDRAISLSPNFAGAHFNRGNALSHLGRNSEAISAYDCALKFVQDQPDWLIARADTLRRAGRHQEAVTSYDRALAMSPGRVDALLGRGISLIGLKRHGEALASIDAALAAMPHHADALNCRGHILRKLNRREEALATYDRALAINPNHVEALNNRGIVLSEMSRHADAVASYSRALAIDAAHIHARINRAKSFEELGQYEKAVVEFEEVFTIESGRQRCLDDLVRCLLVTCDWQRLSKVGPAYTTAAADDSGLIDPYTLLSMESSPQQQLACAKSWVRRNEFTEVKRMWNKGEFDTDKLRIAYLSADFHPSPVSYLTAQLYEVHDRTRFDIIGISFGPDNRSEMRLRLQKAFDRFVDVAHWSDEDVSKLVRELKVHIAIDLMGHTYNSRLGIFAARAAPIQANYLAFPGAIGADFIDYNIADRIVVPSDEMSFYSEKIVYLPPSYFVNDSKRPIAARAFSRQEEGLPDRGFVFCCFNNTRKIGKQFFDIWMRLLKRVPGSVLWLFRSNSVAVANLTNEAQASGVDPGRLVFATAKENPDHLSRTRLADLFLDTFPFNACTTASDALWAGVPVLTCEGNTFVGRNASSLLHAVGLPELVTTNLEDYEELALKLATDPPLLQSIRLKLDQNRLTYPLFNADRFARHLEIAFTTMVDIWRHGGEPRSFSVVPLP